MGTGESAQPVQLPKPDQQTDLEQKNETKPEQKSLL